MNSYSTGISDMVSMTLSKNNGDIQKREIIGMVVAGVYNHVEDICRNQNDQYQKDRFYSALKDVSQTLDDSGPPGLDRIISYRTIIRQHEYLNKYIDAAEQFGEIDVTIEIDEFIAPFLVPNAINMFRKVNEVAPRIKVTGINLHG